MSKWEWGWSGEIREGESRSTDFLWKLLPGWETKCSSNQHRGEGSSRDSQATLSKCKCLLDERKLWQNFPVKIVSPSLTFLTTRQKSKRYDRRELKRERDPHLWQSSSQPSDIKEVKVGSSLYFYKCCLCTVRSPSLRLYIYSWQSALSWRLFHHLLCLWNIKANWVVLKDLMIVQRRCWSRSTGSPCHSLSRSTG